MALGTGGESGSATRSTPGGSPGSIAGKPSSLPTKTSFAPLCSRILRMLSGVSVGYTGTDTWPASQMARSAISHQAVFLEKMATRLPGSHPSERR